MNKPRYTIYKTRTPIMIDGKIDGKIWDKAPWSDRFIDLISGEPVIFDTRVKCLWDEENLYLAVKVDNTNTLGNQTEKVELTLGEAVLTVDMVNKTVTGLTGIEAKVTDTAAEISIPFRVLDIPFAITGQTLPVFFHSL